MSETKRDYKIGYGKPPRGRPFQKGQSAGNPRGPRGKNLSALLIAALNEPAYVTIDGKRRKITKREAIVTQMVSKSAKADLRATKMLFDMMKEVEQKAGAAAPEPAKSTAPDREVVDQFVARLRCQIAAEAAVAAASIDPRREKLRIFQWPSIRSPFCLELLSRKPSWPAFMCERTNRPDIWTQAISSKHCKTPRKEGAVHICKITAWRGSEWRSRCLLVQKLDQIPDNKIKIMQINTGGTIWLCIKQRRV